MILTVATLIRKISFKSTLVDVAQNRTFGLSQNVPILFIVVTKRGILKWIKNTCYVAKNI